VFELKKAVSALLMPLPAALVLLAIGAALLLLGRRQRLGRLLVAAAAAILVIFSNSLVSTALLGPLEARYPAVPEFSAGAGPGRLAGCRYVVVLGGGNSDSPGLPASSLLSSFALGRLVEGCRILRELPGARLIVTGPGRHGHPTHAARLAAAAESLGVPASRIDMIGTARDTEDESHAVAALAHGARVALVTSAWHMPRAAHLFRKAGADFVPCPADFLGLEPLSPRMALVWGPECLERSTFAVHEWLGLLWLRLRGA
jgi:uncharacterized SAM-binding protein YcdF (DUF218 family)